MLVCEPCLMSRTGGRQKTGRASEIRYEDAFVTYVDILGFRQLVETRSAAEIDSILKIVRKHTTSRRDLVANYRAEILSFSDLTVRVVPLDTEVETKGVPTALLLLELFGGFLCELDQTVGAKKNLIWISKYSVRSRLEMN